MLQPVTVHCTKTAVDRLFFLTLTLADCWVGGMNKTAEPQRVREWERQNACPYPRNSPWRCQSTRSTGRWWRRGGWATSQRHKWGRWRGSARCGAAPLASCRNVGACRSGTSARDIINKCSWIQYWKWNFVWEFGESRLMTLLIPVGILQQAHLLRMKWSP